MPRRFTICAAAAALAAFLAGCASEGPMVTTPPTVSVSNFKSIEFWPNRIEFDARIAVKNNDPAELALRKVTFAVDMYDEELFTDSTSDLRRTPPNHTLTVPFPFHISMKTVTGQAPDLLASGNLRVTFRGQVYPAARYGFDAIPFTQTVEIPVPKVLEITYVGSDGDPFSSTWRLTFNLTNTNSYPFTLTAVKTSLVISGKKYSLLHTKQSVDVQPGETQPVVLQMENSPGKTLLMALNLAQNPHPTFDITGMVSASTPYGWIYLPIDLEEALP